MNSTLGSVVPLAMFCCWDLADFDAKVALNAWVRRALANVSNNVQVHLLHHLHIQLHYPHLILVQKISRTDVSIYNLILYLVLPQVGQVGPAKVDTRRRARQRTKRCFILSTIEGLNYEAKISRAHFIECRSGTGFVNSWISYFRSSGVGWWHHLVRRFMSGKKTKTKALLKRARIHLCCGKLQNNVILEI